MDELHFVEAKVLYTADTGVTAVTFASHSDSFGGGGRDGWI